MPAMRMLIVAAMAVLAASCTKAQAPGAGQAGTTPQPNAYFDNNGRQDVLAGGVRMIPITTPAGTFKVWTKRIGNNPRMKVLLLHGGPGATHEYLEAFDSFFPGAGIEYYYYDQLGSAYSDQPTDVSLWDVPRFVDEVEQVRTALGLSRDNFYLYGHSWGGVLAMEYALAHQEHLKALIISDMMASGPAYDDYAHKVLMPAMDQKALKEIETIEARKQFESPRYMELLMPHFYVQHILRMPAEQWPDPVMRAFTKINRQVYVLMQGPSEMGVGGKLEKWDRTADLPKITVPTLTIGAQYDTMDPKHMEMMSKSVKKGRYLYCPNGSHLALYDDQHTYFNGLISFIKDVDSGGF